MNTDKLHQTALATARNRLLQGFDMTAYLVYSIADSKLTALPDAEISDTEIDDNLKATFSDFVRYYHKKADGESAEQELSAMLVSFRKILTELYYQGNSDEKEKIRDTVDSLRNL